MIELMSAFSVLEKKAGWGLRGIDWNESKTLRRTLFLNNTDSAICLCEAESHPSIQAVLYLSNKGHSHMVSCF